MKNFFSEINGVTLTFSDIQNQNEFLEYVDVLIERIKNSKIDYIYTQIPGFEILDAKGFSDKEIDYWLDYTKRDSSLIWESAKEIQGDWLA